MTTFNEKRAHELAMLFVQKQNESVSYEDYKSHFDKLLSQLNTDYPEDSVHRI